jgi:hypothetical protein
LIWTSSVGPGSHPARVVVEAGGVLQAELLVVIGANPLRGIDRTGVERLEDLTTGDDLHGRAEAGHDLAAEPGDAHREPADVVDAVDLLVEPTLHLDAGVAGRELDHVEAVGVDLLEHLQPATVEQPRVLWRSVSPNGSAVPNPMTGVLPT